MDSLQIKSICDQIRSLGYGKKVGGFVYLFSGSLQPYLGNMITTAIQQYHETDMEDLVVKVSVNDIRNLSILHYPDFLSDPHPSLCCALNWRDGEERYRRWTGANHPILHRKELLLPTDHPARTQFEELTRREEDLGLFSDSTKIGWSENWNKRLSDIGILIEDYKIIRAANGNRTS